MAFLERFVSDVRITLQTRLLEELPLFLQQKFQLDELEVEKALCEFLNGTTLIKKQEQKKDTETITCTPNVHPKNVYCPYIVLGEACGTKIRGNFKYCSKHRNKKDIEQTFNASENVIIRNDTIKSWIIADTEFTVKSPNDIIVDGLVKGSGKNAKKLPLTKDAIKKAKNMGLRVVNGKGNSGQETDVFN